MLTLLRKSVFILSPLVALAHFILTLVSPSYLSDPFLKVAALVYMSAVIASELVMLLVYAICRANGLPESEEEKEMIERGFKRELLFSCLPSVVLTIAASCL